MLWQFVSQETHLKRKKNSFLKQVKEVWTKKLKEVETFFIFKPENRNDVFSLSLFQYYAK